MFVYILIGAPIVPLLTTIQMQSNYLADLMTPYVENWITAFQGNHCDIWSSGSIWTMNLVQGLWAAKPVINIVPSYLENAYSDITDVCGIV